MASIYQIISIVAFVLAGISGIIAVILWVRLDIKKIIGDLSGYSAKKTIKEMHAQADGRTRKRVEPIRVKNQQDITEQLDKTGEIEDTALLVADTGSEETTLLMAEDMEGTQLLSAAPGTIETIQSIELLATMSVI